MEHGRSITITPDVGDAVTFNAPDFALGDVSFIVSDFQNMDGPQLRMTQENRPGKSGGYVWPSLDAMQFPGIQGTIVSDDGTPESSFNREQTLRRLYRAMRRRWATMEWTNSDGVTRRMRVAAVNLSISGVIPKTFLLQMISDQAQKDGGTEHTLTISESGEGTVSNAGDMEAWMTGRLYGPWTTCTLTNTETGVILDLAGTVSVADGEWVEFDMLDETLYLNADPQQYVGAYLTEYADFFSVDPGDSVISFVSDDGGSAYLRWRDAWA